MTNKTKCPVCTKLCSVKRGVITSHGYREIRRGRTNTIQTQAACIGSGTIPGMTSDQIREYSQVHAILWTLSYIARGELGFSPWLSYGPAADDRRGARSR